MSFSATEIQVKHDFYTNNVVPRLEQSSTFLGNSEYEKDFYSSTRGHGHLASQSFLDPSTNREKTFLIFGEVATADHGTKLGAQGNHFQGSGRYNEAVRHSLLLPFPSFNKRLFSLSLSMTNLLLKTF